MGYTLTIGNAKLAKDADYLRIDVDEVELPDAPLNSNDDHSNSIGPSYTTWSNFAARAGLKDVFFGEVDGLLRPHPGAVLLTPAHLDAFKAAKLPKTADEWDYKRLAWLIWWTEWALANCEFPTFKNS